MRYPKNVRVAVLSSGGKDSTYACWWAIMQGWQVEAMVTVHITSDDSMMFQTNGVSIAALQSAAMDVPWLPVLSDGKEEFEISDLEVALSDGIDSTSNFVEHPEVVSDRLRQFASVVPKDQIMAGTDCGFSTFAGFGKVDEKICYEKLGSLVKGAKIASNII